LGAHLEDGFENVVEVLGKLAVEALAGGFGQAADIAFRSAIRVAAAPFGCTHFWTSFSAGQNLTPMERQRQAYSELVLELVADEPDTAREQVTLHVMAVVSIHAVWRETTAGHPDPLAVARTSLTLDRRLREFFQEQLMMPFDPKPLAKRVHAISAEMDAHLTPDNRARIRGSGRDLPMDGYLWRLPPQLRPRAPLRGGFGRITWE
jgi:hypothetical protein